MSRLLLAPVLFALVVCSCCGQAETWLKRTMQQVPRFEGAPCPFDLPQGAPIECGFVVVPQDHNEPDGPTMRLAVAIVRDWSNGHQRDPVMLLAGGPGGKAMENAFNMASFYAPMHPRRDLILFDQRGVGFSEPALECPEWEQNQIDLLDEADPDVALEEEFEAIMACRDRLAGEGHNLSVYNTTQSAADVNAIRLALGYDEINLYGGSYGSRLAQAVMRDHPEVIRSVVMTGVCPLEKSLWVGTETTMPDAIIRLVDACDADDECDSAYPNLQQVLFELIDQLNEEPVPIIVTDPESGETYDALLTGDTVVGNLVTALYMTPILPVVPQAIYDAHHGDYELMTELTSQSLWFLTGLSRGMQFSVMCTEDLIGSTPEEMLNAMMSVPKQLRSQADPELAIEYGIFGVCENWPVEEADPSFKEPLVSDIPTLILEGELDPVTPPQYGRLVARYLGAAYFYELPGVGHSISSARDCALNMAGDFVDDPERAPDETCIAEMPGPVFDLPREPGASEVVLELFVDELTGLWGLVPEGWAEEYPLNFERGETSLDPTRLVLDATWRSKGELFIVLSSWLGFDAGTKSVGSGEVGNFTWDFYELRVERYPADLALAEHGGKSYFVLLVSPADEREALYDSVFLPVVEALAPLE